MIILGAVQKFLSISLNLTIREEELKLGDLQRVPLLSDPKPHKVIFFIYFPAKLRSSQREERRRMTRKEKMERGWRVRIVCENPENQMLMVKLIIIQVPSPEQANTPKRVESIFIFYFLFAKLKFKFLKCFWKLKSRLLSNPYFGAFGTSSRLKEEVSNSCGSFNSSSSTLPGRLIKGTRFSNWQMLGWKCFLVRRCKSDNKIQICFVFM